MADTFTNVFSFIKPEPGKSGWDAKLNSNLDKIDDILRFKGALVYFGVDKVLASPIKFDTEEYNTDGIHDTALNSERLTVPANVTKVRLSFNIYAAGGNSAYIKLDKNGSFYKRGNSILTNLSVLTSKGVISAVLPVIGGDYFTLSSGNVDGDTVFADSWFSMEVVEYVLP